MNKSRRAALAKALPMLEQAAALVAQARARIAEVHGEEEEAYGNLSDGQRDGDLGSEMEQAVSDLSDAVDAIDAIDVAAVARSMSRLANAAEPDLAAPTLTEGQLLERRMARLAPWAKELIARAEGRADEADRRLSESFLDPDPENARQIVVDDYASPMRGKVIPSDQVAFPGLGIRVSATRDGKSLEIHGLDMGCLSIRGNASNSIHIRNERERW